MQATSLSRAALCVRCLKIFRSINLQSSQMASLPSGCLPTSSRCASLPSTCRGASLPTSSRGASLPSTCRGTTLPNPLVQTRNWSDTFIPARYEKIDVSEKAPLINGYLTNGFIVRGSMVYGSVGLLPRGVFNWKVTCVEDITPESFALFHLAYPSLELIILGTGSRVERVDPAVAAFLKKKGLSLEVQDTANACAVFNFFLDEGRPAGAALIPPQHIPI